MPNPSPMISYEEALKKLRDDADKRKGPISFPDEKLELENAVLALRLRGKSGHSRYQRSLSDELCDRLDAYLRVLGSQRTIQGTRGGLLQIQSEIHGVLDSHESLWEAED